MQTASSHRLPRNREHHISCTMSYMCHRMMSPLLLWVPAWVIRVVCFYYIEPKNNKNCAKYVRNAAHNICYAIPECHNSCVANIYMEFRRKICILWRYEDGGWTGSQRVPFLHSLGRIGSQAWQCMSSRDGWLCGCAVGIPYLSLWLNVMLLLLLLLGFCHPDIFI